MKILGILLGLFLLTFPFQAYAQSLSEIGEQLDKENLERFKEIEEANRLQTERENELIKIRELESVQFSDDQTTYVVIGIVVLIIIVAIIIGASRKQSEPESYQDLPRQNFSSEVEEQTLKKQDSKCNDCKKPIGVVKGRTVYFEYDHIDGNNNNNDPSNCQVLCKNCHQNKTERERGTQRD